jgi:hypothetical protein
MERAARLDVGKRETARRNYDDRRNDQHEETNRVAPEQTELLAERKRQSTERNGQAAHTFLRGDLIGFRILRLSARIAQGVASERDESILEVRRM